MADAAISPLSEGEVKMEIDHADSRPALTPPESENTEKKEDESGSELSDLEPEDFSEDHPVQPNVKDEEEIIPDHFYEGGRVPVFKPVSIPQTFYVLNLHYTTSPFGVCNHTDTFQDDESVPQFQRLYSED